MMSLKEFIEKYQEEINRRDFEKVYKNSFNLHYTDIGRLTELFYKCGIDPLKYMSEVPEAYAYDLKNIKTINIPDSVTSIGPYVFLGCGKLTDVIYEGTKKQWKAVRKSFDWDSISAIEIIQCIDGEI